MYLNQFSLDYGLGAEWTIENVSELEFMSIIDLRNHYFRFLNFTLEEKVIIVQI